MRKYTCPDFNIIFSPTINFDPYDDRSTQTYTHTHYTLHILTHDIRLSYIDQPSDASTESNLSDQS